MENITQKVGASWGKNYMGPKLVKKTGQKRVFLDISLVVYVISKQILKNKCLTKIIPTKFCLGLKGPTVAAEGCSPTVGKSRPKGGNFQKFSGNIQF